MRSFAIAALVAVAQANKVSQEHFDFVGFISKHGKSYKDIEEYNMRYNAFTKIDKEIRHLNVTQKSSRHGHNFMSDFTHEEYSKRLGLKNMAKPTKSNNTFSVLGGQLPEIPTSVDWRTQGAVNPVKDQGQCGSCWAFASTAVMESAHFIYEGMLYSLSEQNLVSCSFLQKNLGCNGGWYYYAWTYAENHKLEEESAYPYSSGTTTKSGSCMYNSSLGMVGSVNQTDVSPDTDSIMTAISQQPQAVAIQADTTYFQSYVSGVLTDMQACGTTIDHAVTAVGYGTDPTYGGYYIVRNSWSASWGDAGYVNIGQADSPGVCGINQYVAWTEVN